MDKFIVVKNKEKISAQINRKPNGFQIKPKNNIDYEGIKVNNMTIIKPTFVEKILKRKIKNKLDLYLKFLIQLLDEDDDPSKIAMALNDVERYKSIVRNNYRQYLDRLYYNLLMKKIEVIENELKAKIMYQAMLNDEYEQNIGKSR